MCPVASSEEDDGDDHDREGSRKLKWVDMAQGGCGVCSCALPSRSFATIRFYLSLFFLVRHFNRRHHPFEPGLLGWSFLTWVCVCVFGGVWHDCSCDDATKLLRARAQRSRNVTSSRWKSIAIEVCAVLEWKVDWNYQKWTDLRMINGGINFEKCFICFNLIQFSLIDEKSCYNLIVLNRKMRKKFQSSFQMRYFWQICV